MTDAPQHTSLNPLLKPGDLVRLKSGSRLMTFRGLDEDGDVEAMYETTDGLLKIIAAPPCHFVRLVEEPVLAPAPPKSGKSGRGGRGGPRKLKEPEPGSFGYVVRTMVQGGDDIPAIAAATDCSEKVVAMWIGRLRKNGYLPEE